MKKIFLIAALAAFTFASCVKDEKWVGETVEDADYTGLVLNEINGTPSADDDRYIELYNNSAAEIELNGVAITYNGTTTWKGGASHKIATGGFLVLQGTKNTGDMSTGLSSGKQIRVELRAPSGDLIDFFQRGNGDGNTSVTGATGMSYSRVPNGMGAWYLTDAAGTKGAANASSTTGLTIVESEQPNNPLTF